MRFMHAFFVRSRTKTLSSGLAARGLVTGSLLLSLNPSANAAASQPPANGVHLSRNAGARGTSVLVSVGGCAGPNVFSLKEPPSQSVCQEQPAAKRRTPPRLKVRSQRHFRSLTRPKMGQPSSLPIVEIRNWLPNYLNSNLPLFNYGSADGCPTSGPDSPSLGCNNGWTVGDVVYVSGGANRNLVRPIPEIYYNVNGPQWANIGKASSPVFTFVGALSQYSGGSGGNTPAQAWTALYQTTGQARLPWSSNI